MNHADTNPLIGPLQVRVMAYIWEQGPSTVHQVHDHLNAQPGAQKLAYTTILTVMRNLARRKVLAQTAAARSHVFAAMVDKTNHLAQVAAYVVATYFEGNADVAAKAFAEAAKASK
jgi:BlaI family transcriptional regulator, penicillinase repressor